MRETFVVNVESNRTAALISVWLKSGITRT